MITPIQSFLANTATMPPTAADLFSLVNGMGWQIQAFPDGKASLRVPDSTEPLAHKIAKLLRREPWRSEVLEIAKNPPKIVEPMITETCSKCQSTVTIGNGIRQEDVATCCKRETGMNCPYGDRR